MQNNPLLVGVDVGTTAVKLGVFDQNGTLLFMDRTEYPTTYHGVNAVEQMADDWFAPVRVGLNKIQDQFPQSEIAALGICSQVNTHVFVDVEGIPLMPAFVWKDGRAAKEAIEIDAFISSEQKEAWWGTQMPIDASHVLSRMLWVKNHHPDIWAKTHMVLSPKDYCLFQLTGKFLCDPISAFATVDMSGNYISELFDLIPGARERSPELSSFDKVVGKVKFSTGSDREIPIITGTMDAWANIFGSGAFQPHKGIYMSGTSEIIALVSRERHSQEGIISFLPVRGNIIHAGPTQSGGDSIVWAANLLNRPVQDLLSALEKRGRKSGDIIFIPHLQGERAPFWDPYSRGTLTGMSRSSQDEDIFQAVLEGVAFSVRALMDVASKSAGYDYPELIIGGGGSQSDVWCQIRADVLNRTLHRVNCYDTGVMGAAIMAAVGIGLFPDYETASDNMIHVAKSFYPDPNFKSHYEKSYSRYLNIYHALKDIYLKQFSTP